jgi:NAD(P)-dependent dehydrogenase (short-subunit alcohol dehydrogenase family)
VTAKYSSATESLKSKIALITGASRGIGFAIADALAAHGSTVILTSRHSASAEEAAERLASHRARLIPFQCEVRDPLSIERLFAFIKEEFGTLDVLVNNAGIYGPSVPIDQAPVDAWRETLDVNLTGIFLCMRHALPLMKSGAVIVNNLSVAAYQIFPNSAAYVASKHGALGLTNATREDVRQRGIRVIALLPGATDTEIWNQFWPEAPREKMMQAKDVAQAVVSALLMPPETSMDEIHIMPAAGTL